MTLLDAQEYDPEKARKRRNRIISVIAILLIVVCFVWWNRYWPEERVARHFFAALQRQDYKTAYGIWMHDPNWQQHPEKYRSYTFDRFQADWGSNSSQNEYGVIQSHKIVAARVFRNVLLVGLLINGRKSKALFLTYYPKDHTLDFAPPDEELYLGP